MSTLASPQVELGKIRGIDRIRYMYNGSSDVHVTKAESMREFVQLYSELPLVWDDVYGCYRLERSIGQLRIVMVYLSEEHMEPTEYEDICVRSATDHARQLLASVLADAGVVLMMASKQVGHVGESNPTYTRDMLDMLLKQVQDDAPFNTYQLLKGEDENGELPNFDLALDRVNEEMRGCLKGLINGLDTLCGVVSRGCGDSGNDAVATQREPAATVSGPA